MQRRAAIIIQFNQFRGPSLITFWICLIVVATHYAPGGIWTSDTGRIWICIRITRNNI
jgi:hypothetical protein